MAETSITCPTLVDGEPCGGEVIVEWEQNQLPPEKTGRKVCYYCNRASEEVEPGMPCSMDNCLEELSEEQMEKAEHLWEEEFVEGDYRQELVSYRTYCWHPLTKNQAEEMLNDQWAAGAERAAEMRYR